MKLFNLTKDDSNQGHTVVLDGVDYLIRIRWNERASKWIFDLKASDGTPLAMGRSFVCYSYLAKRGEVDSRMPKGALFVCDYLDTGVDPGLHEINRRVFLVYFSESDLS